MKKLTEFVSQSSVTYTPVDATQASNYSIDKHHYPIPETDAIQFAATVAGKLMDSETEAKLKARYGEHWKELVTQAVGVAATIQPDSHTGNGDSSRWMESVEINEDKIPRDNNATPYPRAYNIGGFHTNDFRNNLEDNMGIYSYNKTKRKGLLAGHQYIVMANKDQHEDIDDWCSATASLHGTKYNVRY